jgi:hypothetical protein
MADTLDPPSLFRKRSTVLETHSSLALAHTLLFEAAEEAERAAQEEKRRAAERKQVRQLKASCPSLMKAMETLAKPFDATAKTKAQVVPVGETSAGGSKRSSLQPGGLQALLDAKERELSRRNSITAALAEDSKSSPAADTDDSRSTATSRASTSRRTTATGSSPATAGLATFKQNMRQMLVASQTARDADVDLAVGDDHDSPFLPTKRNRVGLDDLIQMERELDEEFGSLPASNGAYIRSHPASKQASRRSSAEFSSVSSSTAGSTEVSPSHHSSITTGARARTLADVRRITEAQQEQKNIVLGSSPQSLGAKGAGMDHISPPHSRPSSRSDVQSAAGAPTSRRTSLTNASHTVAAPLPVAHPRRQSWSLNDGTPLAASQPATRSPPLRPAEAAEPPRGLKDIDGGIWVPQRPITAITTAGSITSRSHAQISTSLFTRGTASSSAKTKPPVEPMSKRPQTAALSRGATAAVPSPPVDSASAVAPTPPSILAPPSIPAMQRITVSPLLRSRKLDSELSPTSAADDQLSIEAAALEEIAVEKEIDKKLASRARNARRASMPAGMLEFMAKQLEAKQPPTTNHPQHSDDSSRQAASESTPPKRMLPTPPKYISMSVVNSRAGSPMLQVPAYLPTPPTTQPPVVPATVKKSISSSEVLALTSVSPTAAATAAALAAASSPDASSSTSHLPQFKPTPPKTLSSASSLASLKSIEPDQLASKAGAPAGKVKLKPIKPIKPTRIEAKDQEITDEDDDEVRSNNGDASYADPATKLLPLKTDLASPSKKRRARSHKATPSPNTPSRPRSSHHVFPSTASTASLASTTNSNTSTASAFSTSSSRLSTQVSSSLSSHKHSTLVDKALTQEVTDQEKRVKQAEKEWNRLRHVGETKAAQVVAKTRELSQMVDASQADAQEIGHLRTQLAERESEWTDMLFQQSSLASENTRLSGESALEEQHQRKVKEEMNQIHHIQGQLDTKIQAGSKRLSDAVQEHRHLASEIATLKESFHTRESQYAAELRVQKRHVETLKILRRNREREVLEKEDLKGASMEELQAKVDAAEEESRSPTNAATTNPVSPTAANAEADHLTRLWTARMHHIQSTTGIDDFLALCSRVGSHHPSSTLHAETEIASKKTELEERKRQQKALAMLLGMKRMAAQRQQMERAASDDAAPTSEEAAAEMLERAQAAMSKLASVEATLAKVVPVPSAPSTSDDPVALLSRLSSIADEALSQLPRAEQT